jgi:hypothetical protein
MYRERGNSSAASIGGVIERGRSIGGREGVVAVAFGPGVTVEMVLLRRCEWKGRAEEGGKTVSNGSPEEAGLNTVPNGVTEEVGGRDLDRKAEAIVEEAKAQVPVKMQAGLRGEEMKDVGRCVCISPSYRFGGSGQDCWCRS